MKNPTNNSEFMDDINADDQFIMHDAIEDAREERYEDLPIEFQSMDAFAPGVIDDWDGDEGVDDVELGAGWMFF